MIDHAESPVAVPTNETLALSFIRDIAKRLREHPKTSNRGVIPDGADTAVELAQRCEGFLAAHGIKTEVTT